MVKPYPQINQTKYSPRHVHISRRAYFPQSFRLTSNFYRESGSPPGRLYHIDRIVVLNYISDNSILQSILGPVQYPESLDKFSPAFVVIFVHNIMVHKK